MLNARRKVVAFSIITFTCGSEVPKEKETMNQQSAPLCVECKTTMRSGQTDFLYRDDGIEITVPHVPAWLCQQNHALLFTPETTDQLIETLRELAATAQRARVRQPVFHEYLVKVA